MPVTKTAKRALRSSKRKAAVNALIVRNLELAIRLAKKGQSSEKILAAISLADRATKKRVIHKNKAARIKRALAKITPKATKIRKPASKVRRLKKK